MWRSLLKTVVWPVPGQLRIFVFIPVVLCDQTLTGVDSSYYNGKGCGYCCVWKSGGIWHDRMVPAVYGSDDIQNLPTSHLHVHFRSLAIRQIEAELRGALVRKLQHLSILYHKQMSSGRLQSKIMRDVEAVENLSTQMFIQMVSILLSIGIALTVTLAHSRIVFIMFLVTIPLSAAAVFLSANG